MGLWGRDTNFPLHISDNSFYAVNTRNNCRIFGTNKLINQNFNGSVLINAIVRNNHKYCP